MTDDCDDRREAMRQANLENARAVILTPVTPEHQARLDKAWADFDAAYPHPMDLQPKHTK